MSLYSIILSRPVRKPHSAIFSSYNTSGLRQWNPHESLGFGLNFARNFAVRTEPISLPDEKYDENMTKAGFRTGLVSCVEVGQAFEGIKKRLLRLALETRDYCK